MCYSGIFEFEFEFDIGNGARDKSRRNSASACPYNHGAFGCKLGTLAIGRTDSQLYNHFHFNPWTTLEENKERAASRMLAWKPDLYRWVETGDHNHPVDFEFPDAHGHAHGDHPHHHGDGKVAHKHVSRRRRK